jgi:hypothetical protein
MLVPQEQVLKSLHSLRGWGLVMDALKGLFLQWRSPASFSGPSSDKEASLALQGNASDMAPGLCNSHYMTPNWDLSLQDSNFLLVFPVFYVLILITLVGEGWEVTFSLCIYFDTEPNHVSMVHHKGRSSVVHTHWVKGGEQLSRATWRATSQNHAGRTGGGV